MSKLPAQRPEHTRDPGPCPRGGESAKGGSTERQALVALARLLGRQAARDFVLQKSETDGRISEPVVDDV